jgi:hypothetical protein
LIEDITNNAIQRGFYNGVRSERKKGETKWYNILLAMT